MKTFSLIISLLSIYFGVYGQTVYSTHVSPVHGVHFSGTVNALTCIGCTISNASNAADSTTGNFAVMSKLAAVAGSMRLRMRLNGMGVSVAGVTIEEPTTLLTASMLAGVTIRTFRDGVLQEWRTGGTDLLTTRVVVGGIPTNRVQVWFPTVDSFDEVEIEIGGLANVLLTTRVYYAFGQVGLLPVKLAYQKVTRDTQSNKPIISWETASEKDVALFEIQRTVHIGFEPETVGRVLPSNRPSSYAFHDEQAEAQNGYYYRIKTIDTDASYSLGQWMSVAGEMPLVADISILGTTMYINILTDQKNNWQLMYIDMAGRLVATSQFTTASGPSYFTFDISDLAKQPLIVRLTCMGSPYAKTMRLAMR